MSSRNGFVVAIESRDFEDCLGQSESREETGSRGDGMTPDEASLKRQEEEEVGGDDRFSDYSSFEELNHARISRGGGQRFEEGGKVADVVQTLREDARDHADCATQHAFPRRADEGEEREQHSIQY